MKFSIKATVILFSVALLAPSRGARAGDTVLATIDGEEAVTFEDVLYYVGKNEPKGGGPVTAADVEGYVDTLAMAKVFVLEAEEAGLGTDPFITESCAAMRKSLLSDLLWEALAAEDPAKEKELRDFYNINTKWRKYSLIEAKNRESAEAARRELDAGRPWEEVVLEYTILEGYKERGGEYEIPLTYDGMEASRAVFATPEGEYTEAVPANDGIRWQIYRVDKIVHGRTDTFEEAMETLPATVNGIKALRRFQEIASELRRTVTINRNGQMWEALHSQPFFEFGATWGKKTAVVSYVGGLPVSGQDYVGVIVDFYSSYGIDIDGHRRDDPEDFTYVAERLLARLEDMNLREYEALRRGLDKTPAFTREYERTRGQLLTQLYTRREFTAKLPPITDEDCERYYAAHREEFQTPEKVEVYMVALPDRGKLESFYAEVAAGADLVDTGEAYNLARGKKLMYAYEAPPRLSPEDEEWLGVVHIFREPNADEPDGPFAAELRPRAFPFSGLNELSEIFQLADGRWAFFAPIYYQPFKQGKLAEEATKIKCQKKAWAEYYASEEVDKLSREWLASLRAKHDVELASERFGDVAARLNACK